MIYDKPSRYQVPATVVEGFVPLYDGSDVRGLHTHPDHDVVLRTRGLQESPQQLVREGALFERALNEFEAVTGIDVVDHQVYVSEVVEPTTGEAVPTLVVVSKRIDDAVTFEQALGDQQHLDSFDATALRLIVYVRHLIEQGGTTQLDLLSLGQCVVDEQTGKVTMFDVGVIYPCEVRPLVGRHPQYTHQDLMTIGFALEGLDHEIALLAHAYGDDDRPLSATALVALHDYVRGHQLDKVLDASQWQ